MANIEGAATSMAEALTECFAMLGGVQRKTSVTAWIDSHYPQRWSPNTLQGHLYGCCVNNPTGIKHHRGFPRFLYYRGGGEYELYDRLRHGIFDDKGYPEGQSPVDMASEGIREEIAQQIEERIGTEFAYEAHLRDYLAKNVSILETGLTLWSPTASSAIEFPVDGRRIDILARDKAGIPVVIELKLSRGHDKTVGQALYYRAKLKQLFGLSRVRIILVAAEITDELRLAAGEVNDVDLFQYSLTMKVEQINITETKV